MFCKKKKKKKVTERLILLFTCSCEEVGLFRGIAPAGFSVVPKRYSWIRSFGVVIEKELCLGGGKEKAAEIDDLVITDSTIGDGNTKWGKYFIIFFSKELRYIYLKLNDVGKVRLFILTCSLRLYPHIRLRYLSIQTRRGRKGHYPQSPSSFDESG